MRDRPVILAQARKTRYNCWGGNPNGYPYKEGYCAKGVWSGGRGSLEYQRTRKNGFGPGKLYCKQHDPEVTAARDAERLAKYEHQAARRLLTEDIGALRRAAQLVGGVAAKECRAKAKQLTQRVKNLRGQSER